MYKYIIAGITGLVIGITIGWALLQSGTKQTDIKWKFGNNELNINLDQDLVDAPTFLKKIFSQNFSKDGATSWLKNNQQLYHYTDPEIVNEFESLEFDILVSEELRKLSRFRKGPWAYQFDTVRIGIPDSIYQPKSGFANVCESGKFLRQNIKIFNMDQSRSIEVTATGKYECPDGFKYPDIQLNAKDAFRLLGSQNFSKYEQGIALIISD